MTSIIESLKSARRQVISSDPDSNGYVNEEVCRSCFERLPDDVDLMNALGLPEQDVKRAVDLVYQIMDTDLRRDDVREALELVIDELYIKRSWVLAQIYAIAPQLSAYSDQLDHGDVGELWGILNDTIVARQAV